MLVNGKYFKYKCYKIGYAELSEKVTVFKEYFSVLFWKSGCSEDLPASEKYMS